MSSRWVSNNSNNDCSSVGNCSVFFRILMILNLQDVMGTSGMVEVISYSPMYTSFLQIGKRLCGTPFGQMMCRIGLSLVNGSSKFYHDGLIDGLLKHVPAGASYKQFIHYAQNGLARKPQSIHFNRCIQIFWHFFFVRFLLDKFQLYDHGAVKNMIMYGDSKPPLYNMSNVQANIHMLYGTDDMSTPASVSVFIATIGLYILTLMWTIENQFTEYSTVE